MLRLAATWRLVQVLLIPCVDAYLLDAVGELPSEGSCALCALIGPRDEDADNVLPPLVFYVEGGLKPMADVLGRLLDEDPGKTERPTCDWGPRSILGLLPSSVPAGSVPSDLFSASPINQRTNAKRTPNPITVPMLGRSSRKLSRSETTRTTTPSSTQNHVAT